MLPISGMLIHSAFGLVMGVWSARSCRHEHTSAYTWQVKSSRVPLIDRRMRRRHSWKGAASMCVCCSLHSKEQRAACAQVEGERRDKDQGNSKIRLYSRGCLLCRREALSKVTLATSTSSLSRFSTPVWSMARMLIQNWWREGLFAASHNRVEKRELFRVRRPWLRFGTAPTEPPSDGPQKSTI